MKFTLTFKTPDVLEQIPNEGVEIDAVNEMLSKYLKFGEYVTLEFDTFWGTVVVLEA